MADKSIIGLKSLTAFEMLTDTSVGATYDTAIALGGSIEATITPDTSEADVQYADDIEYDSLSPDTPYTIELDIAGLSIANQAKLQGHSVDTSGGLVVKSGDTPPYFAFAFQSEKSGGGSRYVLIYKAKPEFMSHSFKTKEGTTVTRQTSKMTLKGIGRTYDGLKQYVVDSLVSGFYTAPIVPVLATVPSITAQPVDQYLAKAAAGTMEITATETPTYQWYKPLTKAYTGELCTYTGNDGASLTLASGITSGVHFYYCKLSKAGAHDVYSDIVVLVKGDS